MSVLFFIPAERISLERDKLLNVTSEESVSIMNHTISDAQKHSSSLQRPSRVPAV